MYNSFRIGRAGAFPTCVGMFRQVFWASNRNNRVPHMRGDFPGAS